MVRVFILNRPLQDVRFSAPCDPNNQCLNSLCMSMCTCYRLQHANRLSPVSKVSQAHAVLLIDHMRVFECLNCYSKNYEKLHIFEINDKNHTEL